MVTQGGRKLHNYWSSGGFTSVKLENARIGALCNECANHYSFKNDRYK